MGCFLKGHWAVYKTSKARFTCFCEVCMRLLVQLRCMRAAAAGEGHAGDSAALLASGRKIGRVGRNANAMARVQTTSCGSKTEVRRRETIKKYTFVANLRSKHEHHVVARSVNSNDDTQLHLNHVALVVLQLDVATSGDYRLPSRGFESIRAGCFPARATTEVSSKRFATTTYAIYVRGVASGYPYQSPPPPKVGHFGRGLTRARQFWEPSSRTPCPMVLKASSRQAWAASAQQPYHLRVVTKRVEVCLNCSSQRELYFDLNQCRDPCNSHLRTTPNVPMS